MPMTMSMPSYVQQPTYITKPVETIVQKPVETIVEDLVIDVPIERPTVSGGIDAQGLMPTQVTPIEPTFVTPVNETIVEAPRTFVSMAPRMMAPQTMPLMGTLNRSIGTMPGMPMTIGAPMRSGHGGCLSRKWLHPLRSLRTSR